MNHKLMTEKTSFPDRQLQLDLIRGQGADVKRKEDVQKSEMQSEDKNAEWENVIQLKTKNEEIA